MDRAGGPSYEASVSAGSTPLLVATVRAQVPTALFLLEQGADPNTRTPGLPRSIGPRARGRAEKPTRCLGSSTR